MTEHATLVASATASFLAPSEHGTRINEPGHNPTPLLIRRFVELLESYSQITHLQHEYFAECAANIPSETELGYLPLAIDDTTYLTVNNNGSYVPPPLQDPEPSRPADANSAAAILNHQESHRLWKDTKMKSCCVCFGVVHILGFLNFVLMLLYEYHHPVKTIDPGEYS
jgi:hypothetical protein